MPSNSTSGQVKWSRFTGIFEVQKNTAVSSNGFLKEQSFTGSGQEMQTFRTA